MQKRDFLKALAIGGAGGLAAASLGNSGGQQVGSGLSRYQKRFEEILDTNRFTAGWAVYTPFFMRDVATGVMSGIFYELTVRIAELAGLGIDWAPESTFATIGTDLDSGKFDIYAGVYGQKPAARLISFSDALFYSGLEVYHHPRLTGTITDVKQLNAPAFTMATMDGEMSSMVQRTDFPNCKTVALPASADFTQLAETVASGRADFMTIERVIALEYSLQNPGKLVRLANSKPIRIFPSTLGVARDNLPMLNLLEVALRELLYTGAVEEILKKYEKLPGKQYYRTISTFDAGEN